MDTLNIGDKLNDNFMQRFCHESNRLWHSTTSDITIGQKICLQCKTT